MREGISIGITAQSIWLRHLLLASKISGSVNEILEAYSVEVFAF